MSEKPTPIIKIKEEQRRRADNQIWNVAGDYDFAPQVRAYDEEGAAELYSNGIIGAYYKYFGTDLAPLWQAVHAALAEDICEQLVWIGLENACFEKESASRPAFPALRRAYANKKLENLNIDLPYPYDEVYRLSLERMLYAAHGPNPAESKTTYTPSGAAPSDLRHDPAALLDALLFTGDMSSEEITEAALDLLDRLTLLVPKEEVQEASERHFRLKLFHRAKKNNVLPQIRKNGADLMEHGDPAPNLYINTGKHYIFDMSAGKSDETICKFIHDIFGTQLFPDAETDKLERLLCVGDHENCHLYYAIGDGSLPDDLQGYGGIMRRNAVAQMGRNRRYHQENLTVTRTAINRLKEKWQNAILTYRQDSCVRSDHGSIAPNRVWRTEKTNDARIFDRLIPADDGDIYADILIDASLSQEERQMRVALQAYIIAEALTGCRIPVRVSSFCSVSGYTALTRYRDYGENNLNDRIFNFTTFGGNRDGLGIRMIGQLMERDNLWAEKRILIILSDTKPNDSINIISHGEAQLYKGDAGVDNTAKEVRTLKNRGVSVLCVFTGTDTDIAAAHKIYNRDFVRIKDLGDFAQAVGNLFLTCIRQ